jgi:hypothetical protein
MPKPTSQGITVWAFLRVIWKHWITLVGGCALVVLLGIFQTVSGKNIPLGVYLGLLALLFCVACYLAWRDSQKASAPDHDRRRHFRAERLNALLNEAAEIDLRGSARLGTPEGMEKMIRRAGHHTRVLQFLQAHYEPETVNRFEEKGNRVLEELLAENLSDEENPKLRPAEYPKLEIEIKQTAFDFTDDKRIGTANRSAFPNDDCFVTLFLKINPRPVPVAIKTFKLNLLVDEKEFVSYAESQVFNYRFVDLDGTEAGDGSHNQNLNERPPLLIDDRPVEGSLQFIFKELQYMKLLIEKIDLEGSPFTLLLIDTDGERHTAEGTLTGDGNRYIKSRNTKKT